MGDLQVSVHIIAAQGLLAADMNGLSDPYVRVRCGKTRRKTKVLRKTLQPAWDQRFSFPASANDMALKIEVLDHDTFKFDDALGKMEMEIAALQAEPAYYASPRWYQLHPMGKSRGKGKGKGKGTKRCGEIQVAFEIIGTKCVEQEDIVEGVQAAQQQVWAAPQPQPQPLPQPLPLPTTSKSSKAKSSTFRIRGPFTGKSFKAKAGGTKSFKASPSPKNMKKHKAVKGRTSLGGPECREQLECLTDDSSSTVSEQESMLLSAMTLSPGSSPGGFGSGITVCTEGALGEENDDDDDDDEDSELLGGDSDDGDEDEDDDENDVFLDDDLAPLRPIVLRDCCSPPSSASASFSGPRSTSAGKNKGFSFKVRVRSPKSVFKMGAGAAPRPKSPSPSPSPLPSPSPSAAAAAAPAAERSNLASRASADEEAKSSLPSLVFKKYDADADGQIDASEFEDMCLDLGYFLGPQELADAFAILDSDGSGTISEREFLSWWRLDNRFQYLQLDAVQRQKLAQLSAYFTFFHNKMAQVNLAKAQANQSKQAEQADSAEAEHQVPLPCGRRLDRQGWTYLFENMEMSGYHLGTADECWAEIDLDKDEQVHFNEYLAFCIKRGLLA